MEHETPLQWLDFTDGYSPQPVDTIEDFGPPGQNAL